MLLAVIFGLCVVADSLQDIYQFQSWKQKFGKVGNAKWPLFSTEKFVSLLGTSIKIKYIGGLLFNIKYKKYEQVYRPKEQLKRMEIFRDNLKYIEEFNARSDRTMTLGLNQFADLVRVADLLLWPMSFHENWVIWVL